ncbi:MAG: peptidylprolyl isomerase, partial [Gemmatimonadetes bacterium]|nr:peptidylprolyl isomerase [Gemmatimonadota bacterium]
SGGSQFFFALSPQPHLEGRYTIFAQVIDGMDVVDRIVVGDLIESVTIEEEPL